MTSALSILTLGFLLGMRHATDADHVVAIAAIVSRQRMVKSAAWIGALWGAGHTLTIVAVGLPIVVFNWVVAPRVGLAMELGVGLMLILLGFRNLRSPAGDHSPTHAHDHEDVPLGRLDRMFGGLGIYQAARPLVVGVVHGLAGPAAIALLVLTTIREPLWAMGYLVVFGLGTVAGMVAIPTAIALPFTRATKQSP